MMSKMREITLGLDMLVTTRRDETVIEEPPGYMKSTLTTPGPCARPSTSRRPVSAPAFTFLSLSTSLNRPLSMSFGAKSPKSGPRDPAPNVGIAGFYDWSPGLTIQQCAQKTAGKLESQSAKAVSNQAGSGVKGGRVKQWWGPGLRNYTGRMFMKEKGFLTKGEQEIITGIVHNRGDKIEGDQPDGVVNSHREAWLVGKPHPSAGRQCYSALPRPSPYHHDQESVGQPRESCLRCDRQFSQDTHLVGDYCVQCIDSLRETEEEGAGPMAPPSTPEEIRRTRSHQHTKVPPISDKGAVYVRKIPVRDSYSLEPAPNNQKTVMDVYLPRLPNLDKPSDASDIDSGVLYGDDATEYTEFSDFNRPVNDSKFPLRTDSGRGSNSLTPRQFPGARKQLPSPRYIPNQDCPKSATVSLSAHIRQSSRLTSLNRAQKSST